MSIFKRAMAVLLLTGLLLTMASCSSKDSYYKKAGAQWAIDAYKTLPEEFNEDTCNQFWAAGDVYEFPMKADEFFDNGWEIVDVYQEEVDENYLLDPQYIYELCLDRDGTGMMTWIYNNSDEAMPVSECTVVYVKLDWYEEILVSGGTLLDVNYKTLDEALAAFNKDMTVFEEEHYYGYDFEDKDMGYDCSVRITFSHNPDSYSVFCIEYFALDPEIILG